MKVHPLLSEECTYSHELLNGNSIADKDTVVSVIMDKMDPEDPVRVRKPSSVSLLSGYQNVPVSKSPLYLHQAGVRLQLIRLRNIFLIQIKGILQQVFSLYLL